MARVEDIQEYTPKTGKGAYNKLSPRMKEKLQAAFEAGRSHERELLRALIWNALG